MLLVGLVTSVVTFAVGARVASAHHANIAASTDCSGIVSWTASSWSTNSNLEGANSAIQVGYGLENEGDSDLDDDNNNIIDAGENPVVLTTGSFAAFKPGSDPKVVDSFSGTFAWPDFGQNTIVVYVIPIGNWGNGNTSKPLYQAAVTRPSSCPAVPGATIDGSCVNNKGNVAVTLSNTGGSDISLTVKVGSAAGVAYNVPKNSTLPVINVGNLANGSYLVTVTKTSGGATVASKTIVVACNPANPGALIAGSCINDKGNVAVTLSNTGDFDIRLTVKF